MMNAVNLVDGLDGLAAGIVAIAAASFFVYTYQTSRVAASSSSSRRPLCSRSSSSGTTLGFLRHNFYPAKIFMGDSGSMLLGLVLGGATIAGIGQGVGVSRRRQPDVQRLPGVLPAVHPACRPGASDRRRSAGDHPAGSADAAASSRPTRSTSTTG